jgi:hypothetical protein
VGCTTRALAAAPRDADSQTGRSAAPGRSARGVEEDDHAGHCAVGRAFNRERSQAVLHSHAVDSTKLADRNVRDTLDPKRPLPFGDFERFTKQLMRSRRCDDPDILKLEQQTLRYFQMVAVEKPWDEEIARRSGPGGAAHNPGSR